MPVYNLANTVRTTLESLVGQTSQDFEVIVIDDGSEDNSASVIREIISTNSLNHWTLIQTENRGVSCARNVGLLRASGNTSCFSTEMISSRIS